MFQPKNTFSNQSYDASNNANAVPNNFGKIRTLKSDYEDSKSRKATEIPETFADGQASSQPKDLTQPRNNGMRLEENISAPTSKPPHTTETPTEPVLQSPLVPPIENTAKKIHDLPTKPAPQVSGMPNPFGSDNYFEGTKEKINFENVGEELNKEVRRSSSASTGKLTTVLVILLVLFTVGGGFFYWFYFIKGGSLNLQTIIMKKDSATSQTNSTANQAQQQTNNTKTKFSQWTLDPNLDKLAAKLAIKKYVNEFVASSLDNSIREAKIVSKDTQPITPTKFQELFDFQLPSVISDKLTGDYSIFTIKENGEPRMGAVFELQNADSLTDAMKNNESTLVSELKPFYLDANISDTPVLFNSSKYNNTDIRYYNFSSPSDTSLDYAIISGENNGYFLFATSKDSIRSILDYMAKR